MLIHRLPLEIPWPVGPVNVLLVEDDPLTLVDTGPNFVCTLAALERALASHGHRLEDIERIVLTHQHIDHIGLASEIVRRSGAELWGHESLARWIHDEPSAVEAERHYMNGLLRRHGTPASVSTRRSRDVGPQGWDPSVDITHTLHDGDSVPFGSGAWQAFTRPGHSPFDTVFLSQEQRVLVAGDHLLPTISSNPLITPVDPATADPNRPGERPQALMAYRDSLRRTRDFDVDVVYPGHGVPIDDHRTLIDERLAEIAQRSEKIAAILADGPMTAYEVSERIWPKASLTQPDLTLSEVLGHADVLHEAGRLEEQEDDDAVRLVLTS